MQAGSNICYSCEHIVSYDLTSSDSAAMARAPGAESYTIRSPEDLFRLDIVSKCTRKGRRRTC